MKISIYGDSFVTSGIFKSALMNQIGNDHNFKLKLIILADIIN